MTIAEYVDLWDKTDKPPDRRLIDQAELERVPIKVSVREHMGKWVVTLRQYLSLGKAFV